jgi:hypothetical protein
MCGSGDRVVVPFTIARGRARVPFADIDPLKVPDTLTDDQVLFLSIPGVHGAVATPHHTDPPSSRHQ